MTNEELKTIRAAIIALCRSSRFACLNEDTDELNRDIAVQIDELTDMTASLDEL